MAEAIVATGGGCPGNRESIVAPVATGVVATASPGPGSADTNDRIPA